MSIFYKIKKLFFILIIIFIISELILRATIFLYCLYYTQIRRPAIDFDKETFRIICVGESTTYGAPVHGNGYPEQLEQLLNKNISSKRFEVFNLGVCAITSSEVARHFLKNILDYRPRLAIILVGNNYNRVGMFKIAKKIGIFNSIIFFVMENLNKLKIARLLKFSFDICRLYMKGRLEIFRIYSDAYLVYDIAPYKISFEEQFKECQENLKYMIKIANRNKCKVLICNYFNAHPVNNFLREFAVQKKLPFCDNAKIFKEYQKNGSTINLISEDGWHLNAKGYAIIAQNLYESIILSNLTE